MNTSDIPPDTHRYFATPVALITTNGSLGVNVMAAEWTFQISYKPFLIAIFINPEHATYHQLVESKEFGLNLCSQDQAALAALAGEFTHCEVDKLTSELFEIYPAKHIKAPLIKGCRINAECRVIDQQAWGDHTAFVGEVLAATYDEGKLPRFYHRRQYFQMGPQIPYPDLTFLTVTPDANGENSLRIAGQTYNFSQKQVFVRVTSQDNDVSLAEVTLPVGEQGWFEGHIAPSTKLRDVYYYANASAGNTGGRAKFSLQEPMRADCY